MKISQKDLKDLEKDGVKVTRAMGSQPAPKKKVAAPKKPLMKPKKPAPKAVEPVREHAAMQASIEHSARLLAASEKVLQQNSEVIKDFAASIERLEPYEPSDYTFDIERDKDKLLKRIFARVGIVEA